jgi:hypothetical protein
MKLLTTKSLGISKQIIRMDTKYIVYNQAEIDVQQPTQVQWNPSELAMPFIGNSFFLKQESERISFSRISQES